jgi:hypothetical protein
VGPLRYDHQRRGALALLGSGGGASRRIIGRGDSPNRPGDWGQSPLPNFLSKNYQLSTINRFSDIYTQGFISAEDSRRYNFPGSTIPATAEFCFEII